MRAWPRCRWLAQHPRPAGRRRGRCGGHSCQASGLWPRSPAGVKVRTRGHRGSKPSATDPRHLRCRAESGDTPRSGLLSPRSRRSPFPARARMPAGRRDLRDCPRCRRSSFPHGWAGTERLSESLRGLRGPGEQLHISAATVKTHIGHLLLKLHARDWA